MFYQPAVTGSALLHLPDFHHDRFKYMKSAVGYSEKYLRRVLKTVFLLWLDSQQLLPLYDGVISLLVTDVWSVSSSCAKDYPPAESRESLQDIQRL